MIKVKQKQYICNNCGKIFMASNDLDEKSALCTPCWKEYVSIMHSNFVSTEEKLRISEGFSSKLNKEKK